MRCKTRRKIFLIALLALVSTMPLLVKLLIATPAIVSLLIDFDEWEAQQS